MATNRAVLYGYYLSSCTWRVRSALLWKSVPFEEKTVDIIRDSQQLTEDYRSINPAQKVPSLCIEDHLIIAGQMKAQFLYCYLNKQDGAERPTKPKRDGETIVESMAILQYLEDTRPEPSLTPTTPILRARMREICETIVSGIQPLQNVGLKRRFPTEEQYQEFAVESADRGLQTLEALLSKCAGRYCVGDQLTMADMCFVPQLYNATTRLKINIGKYPTVSILFENLLKEKVFTETHPKACKPS